MSNENKIVKKQSELGSQPQFQRHVHTQVVCLVMVVYILCIIAHQCMDAY
jgi:hypothetical protein